MVQIIKRDGTYAPFNRDKIILAINKAFIEVDGMLYEIFPEPINKDENNVDTHEER